MGKILITGAGGCIGSIATYTLLKEGFEIVNTVQKVTGKEFKIDRGNLREGDPARLIASIEKTKTVLDWEPQRTLEDSIKSLVTWYKNNPQGWRE